MYYIHKQKPKLLCKVRGTAMNCRSHWQKAILGTHPNLIQIDLWEPLWSSGPPCRVNVSLPLSWASEPLQGTTGAVRGSHWAMLTPYHTGCSSRSQQNNPSTSQGYRAELGFKELQQFHPLTLGIWVKGMPLNLVAYLDWGFDSGSNLWMNNGFWSLTLYPVYSINWVWIWAMAILRFWAILLYKSKCSNNLSKLS